MCTAVRGNLWAPSEEKYLHAERKGNKRKAKSEGNSCRQKKKCWKVKRKQVCFSIKNELYTKHEKLYRGHVVGHKFGKPN